MKQHAETDHQRCDHQRPEPDGFVELREETAGVGQQPPGLDEEIQQKLAVKEENEYGVSRLNRRT